MFPYIDNKSGLKSVADAIFDKNLSLDSTQCIVDALEICFPCNNTTFRHHNLF